MEGHGKLSNWKWRNVKPCFQGSDDLMTCRLSNLTRVMGWNTTSLSLFAFCREKKGQRGMQHGATSSAKCYPP